MIEEQLARLHEQDDGETSVETGLSYGSARPVTVRVRRRGQRYDLDDDGVAVTLAGEPEGWLEVAEGLMAAHGLNIDRRGVVSVPAVEGRDLAALVLAVADTSLSLYTSLLATDLEVGFDSDTSVE